MSVSHEPYKKHLTTTQLAWYTDTIRAQPNTALHQTRS